MNDRKRIIRQWFRLAKEALGDAEYNLQGKRFKTCVNRLYYAVFYAASALLLTKGLSSGKHEGIRKLFHREFIKTEILDVHWGQFYDKSYGDRLAADYRLMPRFTFSYLDERLKKMKQFLRLIRKYLSSEGVWKK